MSDFTKTVLAFVTVIVFLQLARLASKIVGNGIAEMGLGALLLFFGYQFDIPYLSNGLRIFGGCLILVGFVALIGSGVDKDVNDEYNNGHQHLTDEAIETLLGEEKMDINDVSIEIEDGESANLLEQDKKFETDDISEFKYGSTYQIKNNFDNKKNKNKDGSIENNNSYWQFYDEYCDYYEEYCYMTPIEIDYGDSLIDEIEEDEISAEFDKKWDVELNYCDICGADGGRDYCMNCDD